MKERSHCASLCPLSLSSFSFFVRRAFLCIRKTRTYIATGAFIVALGFMLFGIFQYQWYFIELAGFYLLAGIICGLIAGMKPSGIAEAMNEGVQNIILGALIVGIARAISVVLEDGVILDTVALSLR